VCSLIEFLMSNSSNIAISKVFIHYAVEMMGLIGMGNNPMVGATVAVAVAVQQGMNK